MYCVQLLPSFRNNKIPDSSAIIHLSLPLPFSLQWQILGRSLHLYDFYTTVSYIRKNRRQYCNKLSIILHSLLRRETHTMSTNCWCFSPCSCNVYFAQSPFTFLSIFISCFYAPATKWSETLVLLIRQFVCPYVRPFVHLYVTFPCPQHHVLTNEK